MTRLYTIHDLKEAARIGLLWGALFGATVTSFMWLFIWWLS